MNDEIKEMKKDLETIKDMLGIINTNIYHHDVLIKAICAVFPDWGKTITSVKDTLHTLYLIQKADSSKKWKLHYPLEEQKKDKNLLEKLKSKLGFSP